MKWCGTSFHVEFKTNVFKLQVEEKKLSVSSPVSRDVSAVAKIQPNLVSTK